MSNNINIDYKLVSDLSRLAKLNFDDLKAEKMKSDLDKIIIFIDKLSEINTAGVEPLIYLSEEVNVLRVDEIKHEISQENALNNAPQKDSDYFKVPTVLRK